MPAKKATGATPDGARTIVYIHGIGNKPTEEVLRCQWDRALMGFGLGERSRMAYWCQRDRHGLPKAASCDGADAVLPEIERSGRIGAKAYLDERPLDAWIDEIAAEGKPAEREALLRLAGELAGPATSTRRPRGKRVEAQGLGEDWNAPDFLTRLLTRIFLKDVRDFFFDAARREAMKASLLRRLETGGGPFAVIAHSQGTMIAYSVLRELDPARYRIPLFLTLGSPLGLREVRDQFGKLYRGSSRGALPVPRCVERWTNILDPKDKVAQGVRLASHYRSPGKSAIVDVEIVNPDRAEDAHSATGYLGHSRTQQAVREHLQLERFQRVSPFTIAADVLTDYEQQLGEPRRPLLIELTEPAYALRKGAEHGALDAARADEYASLSLASMADVVVKALEDLAGNGVSRDDLRIQRLNRYVSVHLTRSEAERLAHSAQPRVKGLGVPAFYRIWRNAKKRALLETSIHTVQASAAHRSYEAFGQDIAWAVLDSGCSEHPHFEQHGNIVARWDCTGVTDAPVAHGGAVKGWKANADDGYGHGTHVAGIIAGEFQQKATRTKPARHIAGMAPQARLHVYKVLDDDGVGDDAWIIKAINHIADVNARAGAPVIAGVNLSLGGPYEQDVFGCGFTPLCDELRRLWRQGVVVVLAAGNEGHVRLLSADGEVEANLPYTVGDPANLDDAIAVGSIHKQKPHTYGVSHFSSRGPTVDGRSKPDCVAPGEQILSCRHKWTRNAKDIDPLYYRLDGTSMAAPHVSGILAAFLSRRREFIGEPDRVKKILLENCTDLERDRLLQGAGMPNLVRMLVAT